MASPLLPKSPTYKPPLITTLGLSMEDPLLISLSQDEALVLLELLSRFSETDKLSVQNNAEFIALSRVSAQLDKALVAPLMANYSELLRQAQERIAEGFEGLAPGVNRL